MGTMTDTRIGGLLLIVGSVMTIVLALLAPGGPLIDTVSQFDLIAATEVLAAHANLTHAMSMLFAVAILLFLYGLVVIWKFTPTESAMASITRIGVLILGFGICCLIVTSGMNHVIVHISLHGIGAEQTEGQLQDLALAFQSAKFSLRYLAGTVGILGFALLSLGMSTRFPAGFNRIAAQVTFVCSVLAFIFALIAEHFHDANIELLFQVSLLLAVVIVIWTIILGVGLYKGVSGLSPDTSGERVA